MLFQFDQQDKFRNKTTKKLLTLIKFLDVFTDAITIFDYFCGF